MSSTAPSADNQGRVVSFVVEDGNRRLDKVLRSRIPDLSRTQGQRLIEAERVTVDGATRKASYRVQVGEQIRVELPPDRDETVVRPEAIPLDVVYEDEHIAAINKPAGMVVHPAPGHPDGTLVNALLARYPFIADVGPRRRAGIVHRLDRETSGLILIAKDESALRHLQEQFRSRQVEKTYLGLVHGRVQPPEGIIEVPLGRDPHHRQRMAALPEGKYARTRFHTEETLRRYTLLRLHPYTGRTHQIRVHLAWLGHPVVGDTLYGRAGQDLLESRHFLHAHRLRLDHPVLGHELVLEADLPRELETLLARLRRKAGNIQSSPPHR